MKPNLLVIFLLLFSTFSFAENSPEPAKNSNPDDQLPIEVTADSLDVKGQTGISIYLGNVIISRGTTQLTGDKVTIYHPNKTFQKAEITGKLATFKRFLPEEQNWVNGHAEKILYDGEQRTVLLVGQAYVNQEGKNDISAPKIFYNLNTERLTAGSSQQEKKRIKMTFTPENESEQGK